MALKTQQELYDQFIAELQSQAPDITDTNEGSVVDILAGVFSFAVSELGQITVDEFRKTFFDTAHGPEVTGANDDLEDLAVDHFGDSFARPGASKATGTVTFSRPNTDAGNVVINAGTIVKTQPNASGVAQRFETISSVTMTTTSISASVRAVTAGTAGNILASKCVVIETALTDSSVTVTNASAFAGGAAEESDAEYRETIRNLIETLRGATKAAIEAKALTVDGVVEATVLEVEKPVIEWDIGGSNTVGDYFRIPYATLYIADSNGTASQALIDDVEAAIDLVRACGVRVFVEGASPITINWTASITLNPGGPNYSTLVSDPQQIIDSMTQYIAGLAIGSDFDILTAEVAIMAIWGPSGTNDLTDFNTSIPSGNISVDVDEKPIPGTVEV